MSKAFDTVDRVRLREALEAANADPFLVEVVGMLHIEALYDMDCIRKPTFRWPPNEALSRAAS